MKYTKKEALSEILRRSDQIALRRNRRACQVLSGASVALCAMLAAVITVMSERSISASSGTVYGAFLLSPEAGGYVLTGVTAFVLGIVFTFLCVHLRKTKLRKQCEFQNDEAEGTP